MEPNDAEACVQDEVVLYNNQVCEFLCTNSSCFRLCVSDEQRRNGYNVHCGDDNSLSKSKRGTGFEKHFF